MTEHSYTTKEFCRAERICEAMLWRLWKQGKGPRFYRAGRKRIITHEARIEFQREREAEVAKAASNEEAA